MPTMGQGTLLEFTENLKRDLAMSAFRSLAISSSSLLGKASRLCEQIVQSAISAAPFFLPASWLVKPALTFPSPERDSFLFPSS